MAAVECHARVVLNSCGVVEIGERGGVGVAWGEIAAAGFGGGVGCGEVVAVFGVGGVWLLGLDGEGLVTHCFEVGESEEGGGVVLDNGWVGFGGGVCGVGWVHEGGGVGVVQGVVVVAGLFVVADWEWLLGDGFEWEGSCFDERSVGVCGHVELGVGVEVRH